MVAASNSPVEDAAAIGDNNTTRKAISWVMMLVQFSTSLHSS